MLKADEILLLGCFILIVFVYCSCYFVKDQEKVDKICGILMEIIMFLYIAGLLYCFFFGGEVKLDESYIPKASPPRYPY